MWKAFFEALSSNPLAAIVVFFILGFLSVVITIALSGVKSSLGNPDTKKRRELANQVIELSISFLNGIAYLFKLKFVPQAFGFLKTLGGTVKNKLSLVYRRLAKSKVLEDHNSYGIYLENRSRFSIYSSE